MCQAQTRKMLFFNNRLCGCDSNCVYFSKRLDEFTLKLTMYNSLNPFYQFDGVIFVLIYFKGPMNSLANPDLSFSERNDSDFGKGLSRHDNFLVLVTL